METFFIALALGVLEGVSNVVVEAIIDTSSDFVIDNVNQAVEDLFPGLTENEYINSFFNQCKMGVAAATNARIMTASVRTQMKIENVLSERKEKISKRYKEKVFDAEINTSFKGLLGKKKVALKEQFDKEMAMANADAKRIYSMKQASNTEASAYSQGAGALKSGNDGTIQNMKSDGTFELSRTIKDLLMSQNFYTDKTGVRAI